MGMIKKISRDFATSKTNRIFLITTCLGVIGNDCSFGFRGYFQGNKIIKVAVTKTDDMSFIEGTEYILKLHNVEVVGSSLIGRINRSKDLTNEN